MTTLRAAVLTLLRVLLCLIIVLAMGAGSAGRASCTMHGLGSVASHTLPPTAASAAHHGSAPHAMHQHHGEAPAHDKHSGACCCGGECAGVAQVAKVPEAATIRIAVILAEPVVVFEPRDHQAVPAEPDRLLPFANGPPVVAAV